MITCANMRSASGFLYALLTSASFGLIPLFTLPAMGAGMDFWSILIYRFALATLMLCTLLLCSRQGLRIKRGELLPLLLLAALYDGSALLLFWGYHFMSSGVATTLHFTYPVLTTLLMMIFCHERGSWWRHTAVLLAVSGVWFLSSNGQNAPLSITGLFIVLASGLCYAVYLVLVSQFRQLELRGLKLTFYVFLFGTLLLVVGTAVAGVGLQSVPNRATWINLLMLALIPTVVSNLTLVWAIRRIGSTLTSVMGALEPLTAVAVGILAFGEHFSLHIAIGIALILTAVTLIVLKKSR